MKNFFRYVWIDFPTSSLLLATDLFSHLQTSAELPGVISAHSGSSLKLKYTDKNPPPVSGKHSISHLWHLRNCSRKNHRYIITHKLSSRISEISCDSRDICHFVFYSTQSTNSEMLCSNGHQSEPK